MTSKSDLEALGRVNGDLTVIRFRITCQRRAVDEMRAKGQETQQVESTLDELAELYREHSQLRERLIASAWNGKPRGQGQ